MGAFLFDCYFRTRATGFSFPLIPNNTPNITSGMNGEAASERSRYGRCIPGDLLIEIALCLEIRQDILNLCLTSRHVFSNVSSVLYRTLILKSATQCEGTLYMLLRRPYIARHVRNLIVRPSTTGNRLYTTLDNEIASSAVRKAASAKIMDALSRFDWDDEELPILDDMWFALRMGCPQLRYITTSLGSILPAQKSHFFDFRNLSRFSINLKSGFYNHNIDMLLEGSPICKQFCDMLIVKCPHLEELVLCGTSTVPADIQFIVDGRWPKLRKLSLGDVSIDLFPVVSGNKRPFITFLEEHPYIDSLCLSRPTIQPHHLSTLSPTALERLASFSGTIHQLQAIPHLHQQIKSLTFCDAVELREISLPNVASLLRNMVSLAELKITFTLHSMYDSGNLLGSLIQSCPKLRHLELTCGHKPSFQLDTFAKTIRDFRKLRSLDLTVVRYPGDETLSTGAARIARCNPRLRNFKLTFIPQTLHVPLPFSIPYRAMLLTLAYPSKCTGAYELLCDEHDLPFSLHGVERFSYRWPWGLGTLTRTKNLRLDLRPKSYIHGEKRGKSLMSLAFERSAAGEEIRLILFCTFLVLLASCGIWVKTVPQFGRSRELT